MSKFSRDKSKSTATYGTGYGKPPTDHRFQKGQSGNPKGRPRRAKQAPEPLKLRDAPLRGQLETEAYRMLSLQENGKPVEIPTSQAIMRTMLVNPLKTGNRLALKQAYELLKGEEEKARQKFVDNYHYYADLKKQGEAELKRCQEKNLPAPTLYPHPADILLDPVRQEVYVLGPSSPEEVLPYYKQVLWRDLAIALSIEFEGKHSPAQDPEAPSGSMCFLMISTTINDTLPPSMQRTEAELATAYMDWLYMSKKERKARRNKLLQEINSKPCDVRNIIEERQKARAVLFQLLEGYGLALDQVAKVLEERKKKQGG